MMEREIPKRAIFLYNFLLFLSFPIFSPYLIYKVATTKKYRKGFFERVFPKIEIRRNQKRRVLVHAVSVGEVFGITPFVELIKDSYEIVVSTTTNTGKDVARKRFSQFPIVQFPIDLPFSTNIFIDSLSPSSLILAEGEIWPNMIASCKRKNIPVAIINGRISDRSYPRYKRFSFFFKDVLLGVDLFLMQSELDKERIIDIGADPKKVFVCGSLKFDVGPQDIREEEIRAELGIDRDKKIVTFGSTHMGEEEVAIHVFSHLKKDMKNIIFIIAPRKPETFKDVAFLLDRSGFLWKKRSDLKKRREKFDILLIDTVGELYKFYAISDLAFVGGSMFSGVGGHNILEPLFYEKPVIFGPWMNNFRTVSKIVLDSGAGIMVKNKEELLFWIKRLLLDENLYSRYCNFAKSVLEKNRGAAKRTKEYLERYGIL